MGKLMIGNNIVSPVIKEEFIGIPREVKNGVYQAPTSNFTFSLPSNATDVGFNGLRYAFYNCTGLTSVDLPFLTTASGSGGFFQTFYSCTGLTSVDLSSLTTISGNSALAHAFEKCTKLSSINFSSLTTISGSSALQYIFDSCKSLTSISFPALTTTSFGSYTDQFANMMISTGSTTTHIIHFPSNLQSTISTLTGYPTFAGTSGYVILSFDLPATS